MRLHQGVAATQLLHRRLCPFPLSFALDPHSAGIRCRGNGELEGHLVAAIDVAFCFSHSLLLAIGGGVGSRVRHGGSPPFWIVLRVLEDDLDWFNYAGNLRNRDTRRIE